MVQQNQSTPERLNFPEPLSVNSGQLERNVPLQPDATLRIIYTDEAVIQGQIRVIECNLVIVQAARALQVSGDGKSNLPAHSSQSARLRYPVRYRRYPCDGIPAAERVRGI